MFCHKCGKENPNDSKFCRYCGSTIRHPSLNIITEDTIDSPQKCEEVFDDTSEEVEPVLPPVSSSPEESTPDALLEVLPAEEHPSKELSVAPAIPQCGEEQQSSATVKENVQYEETTEQDTDPSEQGAANGPDQTVKQDSSKSKKYPIEFLALCLTLFCDLMDKKMTFFTEDVEIPNDTVCAFCGSTAMEPMQKNITKIKTGGYNVESACCGTCLLGPFGLLCGLIGNGSKTSITNETWWVCKNCGKQHISHSTALEKVELAMNGLWGNALLGGAICSCFLYWAISGRLTAVLAVLLSSIGIPLIIAGSQYDAISKELGYSVADIMDTDKRKSYALVLLGCMGLFAAAMLFVVPVLERLA